MKNITLQWWNFLIVFVLIFLIGVIIGLWVIPHPSRETAGEPAAQVISGIVESSEQTEPVRAVGDIKPPKLIKKVEPVYPEIARQSRVEGTVICEATTDVYGRVQRIKVLRSVPLLDQAAVDAIQQWVYEPMVVEGEPRGVVFTVTVRFKLDKEEKEAGGVLGTIPVEGVIEDPEPPPPVKAEGDVQPPKLVKKVEPLYPEEARKNEIKGVVILEAQTDIYGRIKEAKVIQSAHPLLDKAALDAVYQWVYEPMIIDGNPREVTFTVTVSFKLK